MTDEALKKIAKKYGLGSMATYTEGTEYSVPATTMAALREAVEQERINCHRTAVIHDADCLHCDTAQNIAMDIKKRGEK